MKDYNPTDYPVPSKDTKDLLHNSGLLDEWATSVRKRYTDRLGKEHLTSFGMEMVFNDLIGEFETKLIEAIKSSDFTPVESFQRGVQLPNNEINERSYGVLDVRTGIYYKWAGDLPKKVPAGSTPESTGGIYSAENPSGLWVIVGDSALRKELSGNAGASAIGTNSGMTVEEKLGLQYIALDDYLPYNFDRTGKTDYVSYLRTALTESALAGKMLVMPSCPLLVDVTGGDILLPENTRLKFLSKSSLMMAPTAKTVYSVLTISDVSNVEVYNAVVIGDKYTHLADLGEHGHGISIRGMARNIKLFNPFVSSCWGDGFYIGQNAEDINSTPSNIYIDNPIADKNRRQGMSITSVDGLVMNNPVFKNTKSSDARIPLINGPHAGIDIEPNYYSSKLNNIIINNMSGENNAGPLFLVSLLNTKRNASENSLYPIGITLNGVYDKDSYKCVELIGAQNTIKYTGRIAINKVTSYRAITQGIGIRTWMNKTIPVTIDDVEITDWWSTGQDVEPYLKASICIERGDGNNNLGGIEINGVKLKNKSPTASPMLIGVFNNDGEVNDVHIGVDSVETEITNGYFDVRAGDSTISNKIPIKGLVRTVTANDSVTINVMRDIHVKSPTGLVTIQLADMTPLLGKRGYFKYHIKYTPGTGAGTTFRVRSAVTPLVVNGVSGALFSGDALTGIVTVEFDGYAYFITTMGYMTKVS